MGKIGILIASENWKKLSKRLRKKKHDDIKELETICHCPTEGERRYPIHHACLHGINKVGMEAILDVFPEAATQKDDEGSTPLHYLLHYDEKCKMDVLAMVLDAYPEAVNMQDNYGCTPVFHAVEHNIGVRIEFLALLLQSKEGIDALTIPCNLPREMIGRRKRKEILALTRGSMYPETSRNDNYYHRTPLYIIWDIAMNTKDTVRFAIRISKPNKNKRERKKKGKRLEKAQMMLEVLYLDKTIDPLTFNKRHIAVKGYDRFHVPIKRRLLNRGNKRNNAMSNLGSKKIPEGPNHPVSSRSVNTLEKSNLPQTSPARNITSRGIHRPTLEGTRKTKSSYALFKNRFNKKIRGRYSQNEIGMNRIKSTRSFNGRSSRSIASYYYDSLKEETRRQMNQIGKRDQFVDLINVESGQNKFRVLHAVLTLYKYLPETAYDFAIVHYKYQVKQKEETTANYPLHLACNMHSESDFDRKDILSELVEFNKEAAQKKNKAGQLPLHIALSKTDSPWDYASIDILVNSYPKARDILDDSLNLYPFEIAALEREGEEPGESEGIEGVEEINNQLTVIYTLLREAPPIIEAARHRESRG